VWEREVARVDEPSYVSRYPVLGIQLRGGVRRLTVESDLAPDGFSPHEPTLEDVYFAHVRPFRPTPHR
jgi:hypothetical protein